MCKDAKSFRYLLCCLVSPERALELHGSIVIILLGIWLFFSDVFSVSDVYIMMRSVASEKWWALVFIIVGGIQMYAIFYDTKWLRKHILLVKGFLWCMLMVGVLYGDYRALSAPMYAVLCFNAFRSFFCLRSSGTKAAL